MSQIVSSEIDTADIVIDSSDLRGIARSAQARFERERVRYFPRILASNRGACDEQVGRFCSWYDEGDWHPGLELAQIRELRQKMLVVLDSLQVLLPADDWLLGQRVWYLSESQRWEEALAMARSCGKVELWWCNALEAFSLHGLQRYIEAERSFSIALDLMDPEQALKWKVPSWILDDDGKESFRKVEGSSSESLVNALEWLWFLADPLYLVEGNDRKTEHYARWTVATIRGAARNPYRVSWGKDLDELTVRHGWELGWERSSDSGFGLGDQVIGHKHPEGRDFIPSGRVLNTPSIAEQKDMTADHERPRSLYAPAYAPILLPMEGQVALFPRGNNVVIVGTHFLPADTTRHADHDHPLPWLDPGTQSGMLDRAGMFLRNIDGEQITSIQSIGDIEGGFSLEVPSGRYLLSTETWSPQQRRAGRLRMVLESHPVPDDIASLSDVLMLHPSSDAPEVLEFAISQALSQPEIITGETFAMAWEVYGLGFRSETLTFEVSISQTNQSVVRKITEFLRLTSRVQPVSISWEEPGPLVPGPVFRYLNLDLPTLNAGKYEIRLVLRTAGRGEVTSTRAFRVLDKD